MTHIKIGARTYPAAIAGRTKDTSWGDRESRAITLEMDYTTAKALFVDGLTWSILYQAPSYKNKSGETVTPDTEEYDNSEFCVAGPITDNRDGTMTIKMGKYTNEELLLMEVLA